MNSYIEVQFVVMYQADTTASWLVTYLGVVNCHIEVQFVVMCLADTTASWLVTYWGL